MTASLAKAVLSTGPMVRCITCPSGDRGSTLSVTDPVLGVERIHLDGPCLLVPRAPNLPANYDWMQYESIWSRPQEWCLIRSPRDLDSGLYAVMAVMVTSSSVGFWFVILVRRLLARMSRPR